MLLRNLEKFETTAEVILHVYIVYNVSDWAATVWVKLVAVLLNLFLLQSVMLI